MDKTNYFSSTLKDKTDSELKNYIENRDDFQVEAVQAAIWELERRGVENDVSFKVQEEIIEEQETIVRKRENRLGIPVATVSSGIRFVHLIIDSFVIQVFIYLLNLFPIIEIGLLFSFIMYPLYYIFFEYYYQWTPGKLVSNSIVVDKNGDKPDIRTIILRTFIRLIPFEPFSCFGSDSWGWHDAWSKTYVINKDNLNILQEKSGLKNEKHSTRKLDSVGYVIIITFVLAIIGSTMFNNYAFIQLENESFEWVKQLDSKDSKNILGKWNTNDSKLGKLNFISSNVVIWGKKNLNYKIENRVLTLTDNNKFLKRFVIIESTTNSFKLRDIENSEEELVWRKI